VLFHLYDSVVPFALYITDIVCWYLMVLFIRVILVRLPLATKRNLLT